jgi:uncharacterized protein YbjT (DUF2867 family)
MILISGATGHVGKPLVKQLLDKGAAIRVFVRDERKVTDLPKHVERAVGDLDRPETLAAALRGVDQLYFVTADTQQVTHLLEAARQNGVKHVVKQSTIEADRSIGPGKWHRQQEEMIQSAGFDWTFLRPTMMMDNTIDWWGATIKSQHAVYFPGGKGKVAPVDPRDIAAVAAAVLTCPEYRKQIYELTGPEALTIGEMVQILSKVLGKRIRYFNIPVFLAAIGMRRFGLPKDVVKGLMETLDALRKNEYGYVTDVVERVGGSRPRSFETWCRDHATDFLDTD